ncbi:MAG: hypothetical protein Q9170_000486 [Blastenia crenularia]
MAAQSRLALRSSRRGSVGLGQLPAPVPQNPLPANSRKRSRDPSSDYSHHDTSKRRHSDANSTSTRPVYRHKLSTSVVAAPALREPLTQIAATTNAPPSIVVRNAPDNTNTIDSVQDQFPNATFKGQHQSLTVRKADKRSLRSHNGGSRFKSELASYFADYDEILGDEPKIQEFLTPATRIHIIDESAKPSASTTFLPAALGDYDEAERKLGISNCEPSTHANSQNYEGRTRDEFQLNNAQRLDFSSTERHTRQITDDPLTDDLYFKAHRRAERGEKSHRNREKESAQHEKSQLERILDELKGHAWLKTMGISGITDSEKKVYEPKRMIFIQRVTALLGKFKAWKEEEKRRKFERERASTADEEEEEGEGEGEGEEALESDQPESPGGFDGINERNGTFRRERSKQRQTNSARIRPSADSKRVRLRTIELLPLPVEKPFTSFYSKPYLRDAALSKHRRGRLRFAFGQQVPDLEEREFHLPAEILTAKFITANARSRRAARREGRDN